MPGLLLLRRDTGPEQGARSESRRGSEGSGRKFFRAYLILVFNKTVKNRFIRLLFQQPAA